MSPIKASPTLVAVVFLSLVGTGFSSGQEWPRFRGPAGSGILDGQNLPTHWSLEMGENVRWRVPIPGMGHSSPIVWGDRVFVTTAVSQVDEELVLGDDGGIGMARDDDSFSWRLYCLEAGTGEILWSREAYAGAPRATRHLKASQANSTPATNGEIVVAIFGSQGLKAFDMDGGLRWEVDLGVLDPGLYGDPSSHWGHSSSPVIWRDRVFVQVDRHADSFVAAYDVASGKEIWRVARDEKPVWATPLVHEGAEKTELIVFGGDWERGLDPETGVELWRYARDYEVKTSSPVVAGDLLIVSGGFRATPLVALPVPANGTIESPVWTSEPGGPYTPTPIVYGDNIFFTRNTGILTVLSLASGQQLHRQRLGGNFSASPVASDGKIYLPSEEGTIIVIEAAAEPKILARNEMGAALMATPAIADGVLFIRTRDALYAIAH